MVGGSSLWSLFFNNSGDDERVSNAATHFGGWWGVKRRVSKRPASYRLAQYRGKKGEEILDRVGTGNKQKYPNVLL